MIQHDVEITVTKCDKSAGNELLQKNLGKSIDSMHLPSTCIVLSYARGPQALCLIHISLASHFWDIGKQCRPRSDAAERLIRIFTVC